MRLRGLTAGGGGAHGADLGNETIIVKQLSLKFCCDKIFFCYDKKLILWGFNYKVNDTGNM